MGIRVTPLIHSNKPYRRKAPLVMPKTVKVFHLTYAHHVGGKWEPRCIAIRDPAEAEAQRKLRDGVQGYACVKVTGAHDQEMPE